jgi:hypothetical protein
MNNMDSLTDDEQTLANALNVTVPPNVRTRLQHVVDTIPVRTGSSSQNKLSTRLVISFAAIAVVGVLAILWQVNRDDRQDDVYAAVIKALEGVDTIHITGWTTQVDQRYRSSQDEDLNDGTHHPIDTWEWSTDEGDVRSYSVQGPLVIVVDGDRRYEYDTRDEHLFIREHHASEGDAPRLRSIVVQFESMDESNVIRRDLGEKDIEATRARGIAWEKSNGRRGECWIGVESGLPIVIDEYANVDGHNLHFLHGVFAFDVPVPTDVLSYRLPFTENVDYEWGIDPRFELWHLHLKELANRYAVEPLPEGMRLLERSSDREIAAYAPGKLRGITGETGIWVLPIQRTLGSFVGDYWSPKGTLELTDDLGEMNLNHDLLTKNDDSPNERVRFVVEALGLEFIKRQDARTVWIARYDGRLLRPWKEVHAPVPNPDNKPLRVGMRSTWGEMTIGDLLQGLKFYKQAIVIDETGLPNDTPVAADSPYWNNTEASDALAKQWFEEQFGITFDEETRQVPAFEVRRP